MKPKPTPHGTEVELEKAQFFRALPEHLFARARPLLREKRFTRQKVLFFEGEEAEYLWLVRQGEVRLYKSSGGARPMTLETLRSGEVFGALSFLEDETYPASAEALTDGIAACLPRRMVLRLLDEEPRLAVEILRIVSERLHEAHERLRSLAHDPAPGRLAQALLQAARKGEARVTRRALAETAGTSVETAIRVLRQFERDGVIHGEVGRVLILDERALRERSGASRL